MARPNFFCDIEALNCLLNMEFEGDYQDVELTFDLVELPYYFLFSAARKSGQCRFSPVERLIPMTAAGSGTHPEREGRNAVPPENRGAASGRVPAKGPLHMLPLPKATQ